MFISKCVLHKCKRFVLKGIETFEICPSAKTQIILGTNGSGKSSLLKVGFTVMPASKADFHTGGYKLIHLHNNGKHYELRNDFSAKNPIHSFICDDEELNTGHTGAVQMELIREHFGMTNAINNVLNGQDKFTEMSAIERRDWITLLSSADFEYVIKFHSRVKRAARDTAAVIKHLSGRLVNESAKKIDDASFKAMRKQSEETHQRLIKLHQHSNRDGLADSFSEYEQQYHHYVAQLDSLISVMDSHRCPMPVFAKTTDIHAVAEIADNLQARVRMLEAALHEVEAQYQEVDKQLYDIGELEGIDPKELHESLTILDDQYDDLQSQFSDDVVPERLPAHDYCLKTVQEVVELLHGISVTDESLFDRSKVSAKQHELSELQSKLMGGTSRISELEYRLNHIRNCRTINCPNCNHGFKEGVNASEEDEIKQLLEKGQSFKTSMDGKITAVKEWLQQVREVEQVLGELYTIRDRNPDLGELWTLIANNGGFAKGRALIPKCTGFIKDVKTNLACLALEREKKPLTDKLEQLAQLNSTGSLRAVANSLGGRVLDLKEHLMEARKQRAEIQEFHQKLVLAQDFTEQAYAFKGHIDTLLDEMIKFTVVEEIQIQVRRHQTQLGMLEQSLAEAEIQMGIVSDLNRSLEEAKDEEKALIELEKLLSPRDGIIAEQIMVFINTFIEAINNVIAKVWGYNMALDKCDIEDGELNYKFPMYVHTNENRIPDIEFGSDSQVDIVNQAFRLVVYKFLDLQGYPLYLDELGRTFDEVHRLNLTLALKELMDDEVYSQVFLISHSFEGQNSYPNSQIAVIDDSHVSLNRVYNEHVTII
ncbi:hypothetical protein D9M68_17540 [compost metagenome]